MPDGVVSDAQIAAVSATERRELITRLERPIDELLPESASCCSATHGSTS